MKKSKIVLIYQSVHHQNTARLASEIGKTLNAEVIFLQQADKEMTADSSLVGFGSGIYFGKFHQKLFEFVESLPAQNGKKAFIFYTSGIPKIPLINPAGNKFKSLLKRKGFELVGEFGCRGWDTYPKIVRPFGGISKGRPNVVDLRRATKFGLKIGK
ncbi:flavodoxin [Patescibacteria group bacterium]|nr:flavodoxin [Patescibacteria group bacterium]